MGKNEAGKIKLTHKRTGNTIFKDKDEAEEILASKHFKDVYTSENLEADPKELSKVKSGASTEKKDDETTTK